MLKSFLFFALVVIAVMPLLAQGSPPATPIDGGLSLLLAAGAAYGVKKLASNKNPK